MNRSKFLSIFFAMAFVLAVAVSAQASLITVANPSFENVDGMGYPLDWPCSPWDADYWQAWEGLKMGTCGPPLTTDGTKAAYIYNYNWGDVENEHVLFQTLTDVLTAGTTYTLQIDYSRPGWSAGGPFGIGLLAGTTVLASDSIDSASVADDVFTTSTISFTALPGNPHLGEPLMIALTAFADATENEIDFDNVRLDATAVPEPGTLVLLGLGAMGLVFAARRRSV